MNRAGTVILVTLAVLVSSSAGYAQPGPFIFAYDLQGPDAVKIASAIGLNTLYLHVSPEAIRNPIAIRNQMAEAQQAGLNVILALPTIPPGPVGITATDPGFAEYVRTVVGDMVAAFRGQPALAGWAMADYLEDHLRYTDEEFADYLRERYGRLEALNAAWNAGFADWSQVTMTGAEELDEEWPFTVGRASVDLADYQREMFRRVLDLWAQQVRLLDSTTPLFTGRIALYRSLTAIPGSYDVVVPAMGPDELEVDQLCQNVHAIDIARQAGRFEVVRALRVPVPGEPVYWDGAVEQWILQAGLHGVVGVGLDNYPRLVRSGLLPAPTPPLNEPNLQALAESGLGIMARNALQHGTFTVQPQANAAFLYQPYAAGHQLEALPVYGYISDFSAGEPNNLFNAFRRGGRFGLVDYLTAETLSDEAVDLDQYSFIAAPVALSLPAAAVSRICQYVNDGGVFVTDLGVGMYQSGSWQRLPPDLARLLGVERMPMLRAGRTEKGDFSVGVASEHFPSIRPPLKTQGTFTLGQTIQKSRGVSVWRERKGELTELRGCTYGGWVGYARLLPGAIAWAVGRGEYDESVGRMFSGIMLQEYGLGLGIFATTRLWANWSPFDPAFQAFHHDLWARRAAYELHGPGLFPEQIEICGGGDSLYLLNIGGDLTLVGFTAHQAANRLYQGGFCWFSTGDRLASGRRSGRVVISAPVSPLHLTRVVARPIEIKPHHGEAAAVVLTYRPDLVELEIAGSGARLRGSRTSGWQLGYGLRTPVRVMLRPGGGDAYSIAPLSHHQVEVSYDFQPPEQLTVQADHSGRIRFDISGRHARVRITPLKP